MQFINRSSILVSATALALLLTTSIPVQAQQTVGLFQNDTNSYSGYTLFSLLRDSTAFLIDEYGRSVNSWKSGGIKMGGTPYLLENGHLLWMANVSTGSRIIEYDWDGSIVWEWEDTNPGYRQHHDIQPMPNGNVLILARDYYTAAEAFAAGRDTLGLNVDTLWLEMALEIQPTGPASGTIVWQWTGWDHLIQDFDSSMANFGAVGDHPELMDLNFGNSVSDWLHANSINYNPELDQIVISQRRISEFWVIDHSATTAEAASHVGGGSDMGGDIIYRWGNPQAYRAGDSTGQVLDGQHDVEWIPPGYPGAGHFLAFSNGASVQFSTVVESVSPVLSGGQYPMLLPGEAYPPVAPTWTYGGTPPASFFASFISSSQRLPNGNTLICNGPAGEFREVTTNGNIVWQYVSPITAAGPLAQGDSAFNNRVFRCTRYSADYPGLSGKDLTPSSALEIYPVTISGTAHLPVQPTDQDSIIAITADILADSGIAASTVMVDTGTGYIPVILLDDGIHQDGTAGDGLFGALLGQISEGTQVSYYVEITDGVANLVNDPPNPPATVYGFRVSFNCGNIDGIASTTGTSDISDLTYLVSYLFAGGPPPPDLNLADLNLDQTVNVADLTYLVAFLFLGGPPPLSC